MPTSGKARATHERVETADRVYIMRALSIRQPYAELILQGIKTIEYRSQRTRIIGEKFYSDVRPLPYLTALGRRHSGSAPRARVRQDP